MAHTPATTETQASPEANCHDAHAQGQGGRRQRHLWWMALCCLLPVAVVLVAGGYLTRAGKGLGPGLILLLCPLMHLFMMRGMSHDGRK